MISHSIAFTLGLLTCFLLLYWRARSNNTHGADSTVKVNETVSAVKNSSDPERKDVIQ